MLDVRVASEDALEVHPLALHIDPDIEEDVDAVELVFPRRRLLLELFVVRRVSHGLQRVQVITALGEQIVPATNEPAFVLVVDEIQVVILPVLADSAHKLLEGHLALRLGDHVANDRLAGAELKVPNVSKSHRDC